MLARATGVLRALAIVATIASAVEVAGWRLYGLRGARPSPERMP
jgi:hypothetical protein